MAKDRKFLCNATKKISRHIYRVPRPKIKITLTKHRFRPLASLLSINFDRKPIFLKKPDLYLKKNTISFAIILHEPVQS